jgi:integrase
MKPKGRHPDRALSPVKIRTLSQPGRYADGNGLYLVVDPSGAKRWILRTVIHGRRRDLGLGGLKVVSLSEARQKALECRRVAREGGDPLADRRKARRIVPTFKEATETVHKEHSAAWKNKKHAAQWISTLEEYAFPMIGQTRVDQIDTPDLLRVLSPIWLTKPETARRVRQRVGTVLNWAKAAGFRSGDNPSASVSKGLPRQPERSNHHAALPYAEIPVFLRRLRASSTGEPTRLALEFLILTAARTNEVIGAEWAELDVKNGIWTVPGQRMKSGRDHRVPLSARALEVLRRARKLAGDSKYVFAGRSPDQSLSNMALLMALRRLRAGATVHGFRSAFRDWASERTNFSREVCELALAHTIRDKTEAAYRRGDLLDKRRELMDTWANFASAAQADVVRLRAGGKRR